MGQSKVGKNESEAAEMETEKGRERGREIETGRERGETSGKLLLSLLSFQGGDEQQSDDCICSISASRGPDAWLRQHPLPGSGVQRFEA